MWPRFSHAWSHLCVHCCVRRQWHSCTRRQAVGAISVPLCISHKFANSWIINMKQPTTYMYMYIRTTWLPFIVGYAYVVPCGLVVRIWRFHRHGRGSIPRMGVCFYASFQSYVSKSIILLEDGHMYDPSPPWPGFNSLHRSMFLMLASEARFWSQSYSLQ